MELLQVKTENNNMEKESFFSTKVIIALIVGIIIGFLGSGIFSRTPAEAPTDEVGTDTEIIDEVSGTIDDGIDIVLSGENAIVVRDQEEGVMVNIELVTLENPGWVVIHEDNNGALGNALGAQLFFAGVNTGTVELLRGMEAGKTYYATIRQDDGDRAFDLVKDLLLSDGNGNPVQVRFNASSVK